MLSTLFAIYPMEEVRRYSAAEKKHVQVPQPHSLQMYNRSMGGTDQMDENVNRVRVSIRSKKWYWPVIRGCWIFPFTMPGVWLSTLAPH